MDPRQGQSMDLGVHDEAFHAAVEGVQALAVSERPQEGLKGPLLLLYCARSCSRRRSRRRRQRRRRRRQRRRQQPPRPLRLSARPSTGEKIERRGQTGHRRARGPTRPPAAGRATAPLEADSASADRVNQRAVKGSGACLVGGGAGAVRGEQRGSVLALPEPAPSAVGPKAPVQGGRPTERARPRVAPPRGAQHSRGGNRGSSLRRGSPPRQARTPDRELPAGQRRSGVSEASDLGPARPRRSPSRKPGVSVCSSPAHSQAREKHAVSGPARVIVFV